MNDATTTMDLETLLSRRNAAMERQAACHRKLKFMSPMQRVVADAISRTIATTEAEIVEDLRRLPGPARVNGTLLHLTADRMHFAECDPQTGTPLYGGWAGRGQRSMLYRYPGGR